MKAYRRDFVAIANLLTGAEPVRLIPADITRVEDGSFETADEVSRIYLDCHPDDRAR